MYIDLTKAVGEVGGGRGGATAEGCSEEKPAEDIVMLCGRQPCGDTKSIPTCPP